MTNKEYIEVKKTEYYKSAGYDEDYVGDIADDVKSEWLARLSQIRSGQLLGLNNNQIDLYCNLEGYDKREFIKSCIYEELSDDVIRQISECNELSDMKKVKRDFYKSEQLANTINNRINTLHGVLDDCEQKFGVFEKYLEQFSEQVKIKDNEIRELKTVNEKLKEEITELKVKLVETEAQISISTATPREIVVTRVIKDDTDNDNQDKLASVSADTKRNNNNIKSSIKHLFGLKVKKVDDAEEEQEMNILPEKAEPSRYKKVEAAVEINDIESYILNKQLSSEQMLEISKAFTMDISDEQIIMMIENNLSPSQIKNSVNMIIAKKNAEKRRIEQTKGTFSQAPVPATVKEEQVPKSLSEAFSDDEEDIEDYVEEMEEVFE